MKVNLISFQDKAVKDLRVDIADALDSYRRRKKTEPERPLLLLG